MPMRPGLRPLPLLLLWAALGAAAEPQVKVTEGQAVDVSLEGKVLARFMTAHDTRTPAKRLETYKPYLHVFDPSGELRLTKGPGFDYTHHRGIMLGFARITSAGTDYDRWHMKGGDQVVTAVTPAEGGFKAKVDWQGAPGRTLLDEERGFRFTKPAAPFYLGIEMTSSLRPPEGEAKLDGDPEHAGAQFRPSEKIDHAKTTYLAPGKDTNVHKTKDLPWVAEIFTLEGRTFTVLMLNHPENPAGTAFSAYRDYGRFGAFPKGVAKADAPFRLHYKWLLAEGEVRDAAVLQKACNDFTGRADPVPELTILAAEQPKPKAPAKEKK